MAIKELKTRIALKYDTLAHWQESSLVLKAGELAIAYLGDSKDLTTAVQGEGVNQKPVLFKVGDGSHTFKDLPFASALAADVYTWAKQSEGDFVNNFLSLKTSDGTSIQAKLNAVFATDSELSTAINDLRAELSGENGLAGAISRITAIENTMATDSELAAAIAQEVKDRDAAIKVETDRALAAEEALGKRIDAIDFVDENELATALAPYAKSADVAATYETISNVNLVRDRVKALEDHKDDYKAYADQAEADALSAAKAYTDGRETAITAAYQAYADQAEADALKDAKAYADEVKKAILTGDSTTELKAAYDTLVEIQEWIEGDGVNATELTKAIADEAKLREEADEAINDRIDALGIVDGKVANAAMADKANSLTDAAKKEVEKVKVENATNADIADSLTDNAKAEVKEVKVDNAAHADVADKASGLDAAGEAAVKAVKVDNATHADDADKLGGVAAANYALKTDVQTAEQNAKNYADSLAGNYATAAQGAKADSALQSISAGTGLKVSAKANNSQTVDIDDSVIFIFDCGNATDKKYDDQ